VIHLAKELDILHKGQSNSPVYYMMMLDPRVDQGRLLHCTKMLWSETQDGNFGQAELVL